MARIKDRRQDELGLIETPRIFNAPADYKPCSTFPELDGVVALDFETKDPGIARKTGSSWPIRSPESFVVGAAIRWAGGSMYYPLRHAAGNIDNVVPFWAWLRQQAAKPGVIFLMANAVYDLGWLKRHNIEPVNAPIDVQVMAFLLNEHRQSFSLASLSKHYLYRDKGTVSLVDMARSLHIQKPMENMDKLPAWVVESYALEDADLTWSLYWHLLPQIDEQSLVGALNLESDCSVVAVDMRWQGVRVDQNKLEGLGSDFIFRRNEAIAKIADITDIRIDPFNNELVMRALRAENSAVSFGRTETGRDSVDRFALQAIGSPVAKLVLEARRYEKANGTFIESLGKHIHEGRIHAEFHSTRNNSSNNDPEFGNDSKFGATSGRWASSNPNLQNIPIRDAEIGPLVRACFIPEEGEQWVKLDYASQEPRLTVHFAYLSTLYGKPLAGSAEMVERFRRNPMTDLHGECATMMGVPRSHAKTINLALAYGQQGAALCKSLDLPTKWIKLRSGKMIEVAGDEGEQLLRSHFAAVPFIKQLFELAKEVGEQRGYVKTLSGRRVRFETYPDGRYARTHKALNGVVQGSAADQMKMALVALRHEGLPVNLTVHDEADRSIPRGAEGKKKIDRMVEIMQDVVKLSVPMIAEAKTGASWGECK